MAVPLAALAGILVKGAAARAMIGPLNNLNARLARAAGQINFTIDVQGLNELERALKKMSVKVRQKYIRRALTTPTRAMVNDIKSKTPTGAGILRKAIKQSIKVKRTGWNRAEIGVDKSVGDDEDDTRTNRPIWYAHLVEFGTDAHHMPKKGIKTRKGKSVYAFNNRLIAASKGINHPGNRAYHMFGKGGASNAAKQKWVKGFVKKMKQDIKNGLPKR